MDAGTTRAPLERHRGSTAQCRVAVRAALSALSTLHGTRHTHLPAHHRRGPPVPSLLGPELREPLVELYTLRSLGAIPGPRGVRDDRGAPGRAGGGLQGAVCGAAGTSRLARLGVFRTRRVVAVWVRRRRALVASSLRWRYREIPIEVSTPCAQRARAIAHTDMFIATPAFACRTLGRKLQYTGLSSVGPMVHAPKCGARSRAAISALLRAKRISSSFSELGTRCGRLSRQDSPPPRWGCVSASQLREQRRGRRPFRLALLEAFGVAGGHAVEAQAFEVGDQISYGSPPRRAAYRSAAGPPAARSRPSAPWRPTGATARP